MTQKLIVVRSYDTLRKLQAVLDLTKFRVVVYGEDLGHSMFYTIICEMVRTEKEMECQLQMGRDHSITDRPPVTCENIFDVSTWGIPS